VPGLLKLSICVVMDVLGGRQTRRGDVLDEPGGRRVPLAEPLMKAVQRASHPVTGKGVDVACLGLVEELGDVGCRQGVCGEARFDALEPEGREHEQPRDQRNEQPRHKAEVNTAKVSAGLRIVTGPHRVCLGMSVMLSTLNS
jgi:hypothetical protein